MRRHLPSHRSRLPAATIAVLLLAAVPATATEAPQQATGTAPVEHRAVAGHGAAAAVPLPEPAPPFDDAGAAQLWAVSRYLTARDAADDAEKAWNGSVDGCVKGSRTTAELDSVVTLINRYRQAAGVQPLLGHDAAANSAAQASALITEANFGIAGRGLSHDPPSDWNCWTEEGHEGSSEGNLAVGYSLWGQVVGYVDDPGANNLIVGHRQWLLSPPLGRVGIGGTSRGGAIKVIDVPSQPDQGPIAIAWPGAGHQSSMIVPPRWSLSFHSVPGVDLSSATVTVRTGGRSLQVTNHGQSLGYGGLTTLSWDIEDAEPFIDAAAPGPSTTTFTVTVAGIGYDGGTRSLSYDVIVTPDRFRDDDHSIFETAILKAAAGDITRGCNPPDNDEFCPDDDITREQMAQFLLKALDLPATSEDFFVDDEGSMFEPAINRLAAAGITRGCNPPENDRFCPTDTVTRGQMAQFFTNALPLPAGGGDRFTDDDSSIFEAAIDRIAAAGITNGCNPPANTHFCPRDNVTRGQMAQFFANADLT